MFHDNYSYISIPGYRTFYFKMYSNAANVNLWTLKARVPQTLVASFVQA
jgi:hypothetical protein